MDQDLRVINSYVSMPSRAYTSFLLGKLDGKGKDNISVNALSGLYLISTKNRVLELVPL